MAFPINVAEKNVRKGTMKCPHVMPAKSNKGLGIYIIMIKIRRKYCHTEAAARIPKNPNLPINMYIFN